MSKFLIRVIASLTNFVRWQECLLSIQVQEHHASLIDYSVLDLLWSSMCNLKRMPKHRLTKLVILELCARVRPIPGFNFFGNGIFSCLISSLCQFVSSCRLQLCDAGNLLDGLSFPLAKMSLNHPRVLICLVVFVLFDSWNSVRERSS